MGDHEDAFCPQCGANVGVGTVDSCGCPLCGYSSDEENEDVTRKALIFRVSRHEATDSHVRALKQAFGEDFEIITEDHQYGDNPLQTVARLIREIEYPNGEVGGKIIAVEAAGPEQVLQALVEGLEVPVIRPVFRRDGGRAVVVGKDAGGRDIFDVERYERLVVEMRPAIAGKPL